MHFLLRILAMLAKSGVYVIILSLQILTLQNFSMRLITFNGLRALVSSLYAELGLLKLFD